MKKLKFKIVMVVILICFSLTAEQLSPTSGKFIINSSNEVNPWTNLEFNNNPDNFQFVIVSDRSGGIRKGVFQQAVSKINLLQPEFVMSVGDFIEGYTHDEKILDEEWEEFDKLVNKLESPFFYLPGNHDYNYPAMNKKWKERYGSSFYHFVYNNVLFLCLNTEDKTDKNIKISDEQLLYFKKALSENPNVRWTIVFMHQPLWTYKNIKTRWKEMEQLLKGRKYTVFAGHVHSYMNYFRNNQKYYVLATTGGITDLRGRFFGEFDHFLWVTMTDDGPRIASIMLDGIEDDYIRSEEIYDIAEDIEDNIKVVSETVTLKNIIISGNYSTPLTFHNNTMFDVKFCVKSLNTNNIKILPDNIQLLMKPFSVQKTNINMNCTKPQKFSETAPVEIAWEASFKPKDFKEVSIKEKSLIAFEKEHICKKQNAPVVIDGKLDEWKIFPHKIKKPKYIKYIENWNGEKDSSFDFDTSYDNNFIYVAAKVTDDFLYLDKFKYPWEQDSIMISFDCRPKDQRRSKINNGTQFKTHLIIYMSPGVSLDEMILYKKELLPEGTKAACLKTNDGYNVEIAIPTAYINSIQKNWKSFRLNIKVDDTDNTGATSISWKPNWYSNRSYNNSGTFIK